MIQVRGDLFEVECDLRVLTTNGIVRNDGACVMGRGCAYQAKAKFPGIEYRLGTLLGEHGNRVMRLGVYGGEFGGEVGGGIGGEIGGTMIASFPVKHHWREEADPVLIRRSCEQLVGLSDKFGYRNVVLPRPGCGNGRLSYEDIRPVLAQILDERFSVITFPTTRKKSPKRTTARTPARSS